jgi:hypothetical protein
MKLQADRIQPSAAGLVGEICLAKLREVRALRQVETVRMPLIDRARKRDRAPASVGFIG